MPVTVAARPAALDGCLQTWTESTEPAVVRSQMEHGTVKVRRRTTAYTRVGTATVTLPATQYRTFRDWFELPTACDGGVHPTRFKFPPDAREEVWRFSEPPVIEWLDNKAFRANFTLEQMPDWVGL